MGARSLSLLWLVMLGCGARSELSPGGHPGEGSAGEGGGGGGSTIVPLDPEVDCPLVCDLESCLPAVLVDDIPVGWHTIADGILYYTTAEPEGGNGLFRMGACGGAPELLLASDQFFGYGAIIGDELFVTRDGPETVRLPKGGGAATLFHSDVGDVVSTRAIFSFEEDWGFGEALLVRYHYDYSFGLYYFDESGNFESAITNLPDPDYAAVSSDGFGFIPNVPSSRGYVGSSFGVGGIISPISTVPVIGPLVADDDWLYFTGESEVGGLQHYKASIGESTETIPILGDTPGYILAYADGTLYGASPYFAEHAGIVWHALADDAEAKGIFRSGEFVQDLVPAGTSLYVRTERRLVRVPQSCPGDVATPCVELD